MDAHKIQKAELNIQFPLVLNDHAYDFETQCRKFCQGGWEHLKDSNCASGSDFPSHSICLHALDKSESEPLCYRPGFTSLKTLSIRFLSKGSLILDTKDQRRLYNDEYIKDFLLRRYINGFWRGLSGAHSDQVFGDDRDIVRIIKTFARYLPDVQNVKVECWTRTRCHYNEDATQMLIVEGKTVEELYQHFGRRIALDISKGIWPTTRFRTTIGRILPDAGPRPTAGYNYANFQLYDREVQRVRERYITDEGVIYNSRRFPGDRFGCWYHATNMNCVEAWGTDKLERDYDWVWGLDEARALSNVLDAFGEFWEGVAADEER